MKLRLNRTTKTDQSTIGTLSVDGVFQCYTLEDVERDTKVFGETAIPKGIYEIQLTQSPRFKRILPLLIGVPNYSGVRIHPGNTAKDTEGCILVGTSVGKDFIGASVLAFNELFKTLQSAKDKITIEII